MYYQCATFYNKNYKECYLQFLKKLTLMSLILNGIKLFMILTLVIVYLTQRKECYLDINYILLFCKGNNNGGKEVNFKGRKAKM